MSSLSKPYEHHLQERLRTNEQRAGYLQAALDSVENYSPKDELATLSLVVQDVIKSLLADSPQQEPLPPEIAGLVEEVLKACRCLYLELPESIARDVEQRVQHLADALEASERERARLLRGDFAPDEFQNLCHNFNDADREAFCKGCEDYQVKLFGESPSKKERDILARGLRAAIRELNYVVDTYILGNLRDQEPDIHTGGRWKDTPKRIEAIREALPLIKGKK